MTSSVAVDKKDRSSTEKGVLFCLSEFFKDLKSAYQLSRFSLLSAYYEIKARYTSSYLGPIWIVLSNVIFIGFISLLYSSIFNIVLDDYIPYLTTGYLVWILMVTVFLDGSSAFISYGQMLRDYKISPLVLYCRTFFRTVIIFAHSLPLIFFVVAFFKGFIFDIPLFLLGMTINLAGIFLMGLVFAIMSVRFRDINYVLPSVFQVLILMMPILWRPEMLTGKKVILVEANFIYQLLELVRAPLLGTAAPFHFYVNCLVLLAVSYLFAAVMYVRTKNKIVLWL
jgi:lipopolysaccharide transport system permease protein